MNIRSVALFLNQPVLKEEIKNVMGAATFMFGAAALYDMCEILRGRAISTESEKDWHKAAVMSGKLSLIVSAAVSRPGAYLISKVAGACFSDERLVRTFGPNAIFAINPRHPRHVASFVAVTLALPMTVLAFYQGFRSQESDKPWLTDGRVRLMALFNTFTSRPLLHTCNQFCFTYRH
jgi:hypothetical protein